MQLKLIFSARGEGNEMGDSETENACLLLKKPSDKTKNLQ